VSGYGLGSSSPGALQDRGNAVGDLLAAGLEALDLVELRQRRRALQVTHAVVVAEAK